MATSWPRGVAAAVLVTVLVAAAPLLRAGQQPAPPAFRAGVDLITIEATVLGRDDMPVPDLQPGDFTVKVGGRTRSVVFADFHGVGAGAAPPAAATALPSGSAAARARLGLADGRIVVFVVDRDSMAPGNEAVLLETAGTVMDTLGPQDAVGLLGIPVGSVELTRDHDRVRAALRMMTGTRPRQSMYQDRRMTWDEALGYEQRNPRIIAEVMERECANEKPPEGMRLLCPDDLKIQAQTMLAEGRAHVQTTMSVLENLASRLVSLRGSKHIVFISGGLVFGLDLQASFDRFAEKVARAGTRVSVVHIDQPGSDVTDRKSVASAFGGRDLTAGLTFMTGMTGGAYYMGVGSAAGVFDRIARELSNYYVLGVESGPEDVTTDLRALEVSVNRPGLTVRAARKVAGVSGAPASSDAEAAVAALLRQPSDVRDIVVSVAAYSTRGTEASTLRVLLSSEVAAPGLRLPVEWGFAVFNEDNVVSTGRYRLEAGSPAPYSVTTSAKLVPGRYRLRAVATDADGRVGVTDVPLAVGLRAAGPLQMSDVIVGVAEGSRLLPRASVTQGVSLSTLVELMSADPDILQRARAALEVLPAGSAEPVRRVLMAARNGGSDSILLNGAEIDTATLPPGRYSASVVALLDSEPVGRVSRPFEVRPAPSSTP